MSGRIEAFSLVIILLSVVAATTDLMRGKIYNWLTIPGVIIGIVASAFVDGLSGVWMALLGSTLGLLLLGWMFFLGIMGGGDVKYLMALGAWGGPRFAFEVAVLGVLIGGILAVCLLIARRRAADFFRRMKRFFLSVVVKELELERPQIDRSHSMPFGVPMALAAIAIVLIDPFTRFGWRFW